MAKARTNRVALEQAYLAPAPEAALQAGSTFGRPFRSVYAWGELISQSQFWLHLPQQVRMLNSVCALYAQMMSVCMLVGSEHH